MTGASATTQISLAMQLIRREVTGRYRGSAPGLFWSLLENILAKLAAAMAFAQSSRYSGREFSQCCYFRRAAELAITWILYACGDLDSLVGYQFLQKTRRGFADVL
jgi:hypothetical protein